ncbi:MAG: hypothetical protein RLZZ326_3087 [Planctomycetota bacterium]|jgi:hypothetical protein
MARTLAAGGSPAPGYASGFQTFSKPKLRKSRMLAVAKERTPACRSQRVPKPRLARERGRLPGNRAPGGGVVAPLGGSGGVGEDLPGLVGDLLVLGRNGKAESVPATQSRRFVVSARWFAGSYFLLPAWAAGTATLSRSRTGVKNRFVRIGLCQVLAGRRLHTLGGVCFHSPPPRGSPVGSPAAGGVGRRSSGQYA